MAKGLSLHIGLNSVDPKHYTGWDGQLNACEADANDMASIAQSREFTAQTLLTKNATRNNVLAALADAAGTLGAGDICFLSYSGHGGQVPDVNGDEDDGEDETWCLFDGELVDDELYKALGKFKAGVRILVLSDSCHSGTVLKMAHYESRAATPGATTYGAAPFEAAPPRYRAMPPQIALRTYQAHREFYDGIQKARHRKAAAPDTKASCLLISGCQDNQLSQDGTFNGLFTGTLKRVWNGGTFKKPYRKFHSAIVKLMPPDQTPNYFRVGPINAEFEAQKPFSV